MLAAEGKALLVEGLAFIQTHEDRWDQSAWMSEIPDDTDALECGSRGCLAGWAMFFHPSMTFAPSGQAWGIVQPDGGLKTWTDPQDWFVQEMGMDEAESARLFSGNRTMEELAEGVACVLADEPVPYFDDRADDEDEEGYF